jgi:hypothetical protein
LAERRGEEISATIDLFRGTAAEALNSQSPLSNAEVKIVWSCASTMRYFIILWWLNTGITLPCHWEFLFVYLFEFEGYGVSVWMLEFRDLNAEMLE